MAELNIGALTDSKSYTGSVGTTNIFDLYKFNITSPGSFKFSIDNLSGNADIFLLDNSGATLYSSTNAGNAAETISTDNLIAGDYTLKVLQISGDIKYTLNLAETNTQQAAADTLTGANSETPIASNSAASSEKSTVKKDAITGDAVDDKIVAAEAKPATTEKPVTTGSETALESESETTVTGGAIDPPATPEKAVTTGSETSSKSETVTELETVASKEPKTGETVAVPDPSQSEEKPSTATSNGEDKKTEDANTSIPIAETETEIIPPKQPEIIASNPFTTGTFTVGSTGKVSIDYLLDGGLYKGQLAIISLKGMEKFVPGSAEFIKEAAARAMSNSEKGYIVIDDLSEGARFSGNLPEGNFNEGAYLGVKTFSMTPGDEFGIAIVPNDTFKFVYDYPTFGGDKRPLFSMVTANPNEAFHLGQIADVTGEGNTFAMEDLRFDLGTDKDYNDFTFQIRGATGKAPLMDTVVNPDKDWRQTDLGKAVIAYAKPYITPEPETKPNLEGEVSGIIDDLEKEILNPSNSEKETPKVSETTVATDKTTAEKTKVEASDKVDANPAIPATITEEKVKDTADATTDKTTAEPTKVVPTYKTEVNPAIPAVKTEEKVKDTAADSTQIETTSNVDSKPTTIGANSPTAGKDTAVDSTEKLPSEKTSVPAAATEEKDKVAEISAVATLPVKSTDETEKVGNITPKVEAKTRKFLPCGK
ncbi:MAG: DUF4114 domain-containing protein [Microcoleus sp. SM1_3_4]|nr:DUF4114 domain-containing protein [Microcoleus sp. SM1_3_4]